MLVFAARPTAGREAYEARVRDHVERLDELAAAGPRGAPRSDYDAIKRYIKGNQAWTEGVKDHYSEAQHRKCAYCEMALTDHGDVEHFRPKNAIFKLRAKGRQLASSNNVRGRKYWKVGEKPGTWDSGYWWLAYDWDNYLLTCGICNQQWKNALFPVRGGHRRRPRKGDETAKEPYLLDPYGSEDPAKHLEFTVAGGIKARPRSRHGRESIDVYGLRRANLVESRSKPAFDVHRKLRQLLDAQTDTERKPILEDIRILGHESRPHAGMVRTIFFDNAGWTWQQLIDWLETH